MKCVNHPDRDAIAQCRMCKDLLCESCAIVFKDGQTLCASCFDRLRSPRTNNVSSPIEKAPLKDSDRYINKLPIRPEPRARNIDIQPLFMLLLSAVLLIVGIKMMYNDNDDKPSGESEQEYVTSCRAFDYELLMRDPDGFSGRPATFSGEIVQVMDSLFDAVQLRVDIGDNRVIYVSYTMKKGELRYLEGDVVTVYGELTGLKTYTAVLGNQVSVPSLSAKYIKQGDKLK